MNVVAFLGAIILVLFLLLRPMDLWPAIASLHSLEVLTAIAALGTASEIASGQRASGASPQLGWLAAFVAWAYAVTIARLGVSAGLTAAWAMSLGPIFMVLVALALPMLRRLRAAAVLLLACSAFVSAVAVHQGLQPRQCVEIHELGDDGKEHDVNLVPDGRECAGPRQCETDGLPETEYHCERIGAFGTMSTMGRVRWRGQLDDPNEVAVVVASLLPFVFMFWKHRRRDGEGGGARSIAIALTTCAIVAISIWCLVLTESRGGQLVFGAVVIGIFVRRFGWWSVVGGVIVTVPVVLLSWRDGADAESSSLERAEILNEGLLMLKAHPIIGIGVGQFSGENPLNLAAHNSYLLIATELGLPGYLLWWGLIWMTMKIPFSVVRRPPPGLDPALVHFAEALIIATIGLFIGIFFLSFVYKHIFFVWLGLAGALYGAVRASHPELRIRTTGSDLVGISALAVIALVAVRLASLTAR